MTYYHNLSAIADKMLSDYTDPCVYDNVMSIPLIEFTNLKTELSLQQFVQAIMPDKDFNSHIFMALKTIEGTIIKESLWTIDEMRKQMDRLG